MAFALEATQDQAPRRPPMPLSWHARWLLHRRTTDIVLTTPRPLLPMQHHTSGGGITSKQRASWTTTAPLRVPGAAPLAAPFGAAALLPLHLLWLGSALDWGCLAVGSHGLTTDQHGVRRRGRNGDCCFHCGRPINWALAPVSVEAWRGDAFAFVEGEHSVPVHCPPGGWQAVPGPWPPHGRACVSGYAAADMPSTATDWDVAYNSLTKMRRAGLIASVWHESPASIHPRLRTELLEQAPLSLSND